MQRKRINITTTTTTPLFAWATVISVIPNYSFPRFQNLENDEFLKTIGSWVKNSNAKNQIFWHKIFKWSRQTMQITKEDVWAVCINAASGRYLSLLPDPFRKWNQFSFHFRSFLKAGFVSFCRYLEYRLKVKTRRMSHPEHDEEVGPSSCITDANLLIFIPAWANTVSLTILGKVSPGQFTCRKPFSSHPG